MEKKSEKSTKKTKLLLLSRSIGFFSVFVLTVIRLFGKTLFQKGTILEKFLMSAPYVKKAVDFMYRPEGTMILIVLLIGILDVLFLASEIKNNIIK